MKESSVFSRRQLKVLSKVASQVTDVHTKSVCDFFDTQVSGFQQFLRAPDSRGPDVLLQALPGLSLEQMRQARGGQVQPLGELRDAVMRGIEEKNVHDFPHTPVDCLSAVE
jgi:hypothetical protein